jgi:peptidase M28-like protein
MQIRFDAFVFLVVWMGLGIPCSGQPLPARNPEVEKIVQEISSQNIKQIVDKLVGFGTRHTLSETGTEGRGIGAARRWIKSELERYSKESGGRLKVEFDSFIIDPKDVEPRYRSRIPGPTEIVNVVATLPGSRPDSAARIYVVSGHYDSMCTRMMDTKCDAPGADDDASGTAVSMELARVMSKYKFHATVVFLCVAGEEQGLIGSTHWARTAKEKNWNVAAMLNDDIVGNIQGGGDEINNQVVRVFSEGVPVNESEADKRLREAIGGEDDSSSRQLARYIEETAVKYVPDFKVMMVFRRDRYGRGGDHTAFNQSGFAAVRFSELNEDFRHQHQTPRTEGGVQYGDLREFVSPEYITQVARLNAATLASLALAPAAPENVRFGSARQAYDTLIHWSSNPESDLAGYAIVWRDTTTPNWQHELYVGNVTEFTLKGLSKDNLIFGVRAVTKEGDLSPVTVPKPPSPQRGTPGS